MSERGKVWVLILAACIAFWVAVVALVIWVIGGARDLVAER